METRVSSEHTQSASRYVTGDPRNASRNSRPPAQRASGAPTGAAVAIQRPRVRVRRVPTTAVRYEMPVMYEMEDSAMAGATDLDFEEDFQLDDELKMEFDRSMRVHRRPQRIKYVKCKTRVLPDLLVPYLYAGDRRSRMNAIMDRTGCTIDYCPESPDESLDMLQPQRSGNHYLMCFLVTAETTGQLEAATRLLHILVDRVQAHVEFKLTNESERHDSDLNSTSRQDNRNEIVSPQVPRHQRIQNDYAQLDDLNSDRLKSQSLGGAETNATEYESVVEPTDTHTSPPEGVTTVPQHDTRWPIGAGGSDLHAWHELVSPHARPRHPAARFHRPVFHRVLVDEDGYEVHERPQYEHFQRYSPQMAGQMASPSLRHRRHHEPIYRHDSSDEETHERTGVQLTGRSPRVMQHGDLAPGGGVPVVVVHGERKEITNQRGMKRRLEGYDIGNVFARRRMFRPGPMVQDYISEDFEADYVVSGDEFTDDMQDEASSSRLDGTVSSAFASHHPPSYPNDSVGDNTKAPARNNARGDQDHAAERQTINSDQDDSTEKPEAVHPSPIPEHTTDNPLVFNSSAVSFGGNAQCSSLDSAELNHAVATSVSISFNATGGDSLALASDSESVPDIAIAPSMMVNAASLAENPSGKVDQSEGTRSTEPAIGVSSVTQQSDLKAGSLLTHDNNRIETDDTGNEATIVPTSRLAHTSKLETPSSRAALNEVMINRLNCDSLTVTDSKRLYSTLSAIARKLEDLTKQVYSHQQLQDLARAAHRVGIELWGLQAVSLEDKQALSSVLETAIDCASSPSNAVGKRLSALQRGLKEIVNSNVFQTGEEKVSNECDDLNDVSKTQQDNNESKSTVNLSACDARVEDDVKDDIGLANTPSSLLVEDECKNKQVASPVRVPKLDIPDEAPTFVSGLVAELERTTGLSPVMFSAQKRLLREISKNDPYYYLQRMALRESTRKGRGSSCPFGCAGGSAHKWERKVVSQISSRMKWFDSVAYSLAKVSGGKELLSRKKMNSTIRKLHLVALQLHCLIAHLYCIRKRVVCREVDSLPTALNNSYYEKRMNGYKSRLKLVLHQQPPSLSALVSLPNEDLVRDTFEFYPELLLLIDVWGYDYRHGSNPMGKVPVDLLRSAARQSFDFESDTNGLLQGICEELLGILCMWNDFKWGESLESLSTDDIIEFEAKVKTSIRKILETHANHLLSQWSSQIAKSPTMLNHIRLTQSNVYYSELHVSGRSVPTFAGQTSLLFRDKEENESDEFEEESMQESWQTRFTPTSRSVEGDAETRPNPDNPLPPLNLSPLHEDFMLSAAHKASGGPVLSWSEVYDMRQHCHLVAEEVERIVADHSKPCDDTEETITAGVLNLLSCLAQARPIVEDAIRTSEKLILHSVHHQVDEAENSRGEAGVAAGSLADVESMSDGSRDEDDAIVDAVLTGKVTEDEKKDVCEQGDDDDVWKQPVLKDLVEIVTSTNQEIAEICSQRARSARVRDKLQSQSLELARQSIQIFQTILNMKP